MLPRTLTGFLADEVADSGKSALVLGPRQVGKSTLLASLSPSRSINLAHEASFRAYAKDPELLSREVSALGPSPLVLIDEVQRLPELLNTVQALIDENKKRRFLISGSSARKLRSVGANLLPGRIFSHQLFPLTYWELGGHFDLKRCLSRGTLPEVYLEDYGAKLLGDYIDIYLREEILSEGLVRNISSFGSLLDVIAQVSGRELNYGQLSSDAEIPKETLRRYVDLLEQTLIVYRLPGFHQIKGSRKAVQREKLLMFDVGVRNGILNQQDNVFDDKTYGELFEQWLILQVIAYASYHKKKWNLFYYRDDLRQEIDLVVEGRDALVCIEIKWGKSFKPEWTKSLRAFEGYAKRPVSLVIVYRGEQLQRASGVHVVPYEKFLTEIETYLP